jgi:TonB dependent receptor-like, beta-barrel/Carboxypeptidase regulatory-like domain
MLMRSRKFHSNKHPAKHHQHAPGSPLRTTVAAAVAAILAGPTVVWAQTADATAAGYATPGATVTAHNIATGLTRHAVAGGDGHFVIPGLPPGDYTIDAGPGTEQTVTLQVATTTSLDLKLAQITVTGNAIPVHQEVLTSEVGQVVSLHDIDVLPQYTRNFLEFANQVPGMQFSVDSQGNTNLRGGAQLTSNINVYIDGVSQKDYVFGGITGQEGPGQAGDPGNPFPQLAIDEYKVITSNYKAEYGDAASAIIVAQTRSGTNKFEGGSFVTFTNQNLRASTPAELQPGQHKASAPSWEFGASEGGPIIQDRMHFFVTFERKTLSEQNVVFPGTGVDPAVVGPLLPASVASQFGPTTNPFSEDLGFAKLDFEPTDADRLELTYKLRLERSLHGAAGQTAASAASHYKNEDDRYMLLWTHGWQSVLNEMRLTHQNTTSNTNALPSPQFDYVWYPVPGNVGVTDPIINVNGPGAGVGFRYEQSGSGIQDDLTFTNFTDHTIKMGGRFQAIDLVAAAGTLDLNDAVYYEAVSSAGVFANPYEVQFPVSFAGQGAPRVDSKDKQYSFYLQDDWTVNRHLTVNAGVRWDYEKVPLFNDYVTPASVVTALNSPGALAGYSPNVTYAQLLAKSFPGDPATNINDYISTGSNRKSPTDEWQPRIGFAYDINADQHYVVFGGYGRSFDRALFNQLSYETTKVGLYNNPQIYFPSPFTNDSFGPCATAADVNPNNHCYAWNPNYLTASGLATIPVATSSHEVDMINNNIKPPHSDQFSIGFRTRLADWDAALTFSDIKSYDALIGHLGLRYADGSYYSTFGNPWGAFGSLQGYGALILWDNAGEDENQQVTLSFNKAYTAASGWSASFAYTYSNAYQNNVAGPLNPYAGNPNGYLFDLPNPKDYPLLPSTAVPKHRVVATGSYDLPWGLQLSGKGEIASATNLDVILGCPVTCNPYGGTATPIGIKIPNAIGYRDVDLSLAKPFNVWREVKGSVRFDLLNVFNYTNFDPNAATWSPAYGQPIPQPHYNGTGPIVGFPRTLRLTANLSW